MVFFALLFAPKIQDSVFHLNCQWKPCGKHIKSLLSRRKNWAKRSHKLKMGRPQAFALLPPIVTWVWFPYSLSHVGCVCCWLSLCSKGFSLGSPFFLLPQKPTLQNSNLIGTKPDEEPPSRYVGLKIPLLLFAVTFCCRCCYGYWSRVCDGVFRRPERRRTTGECTKPQCLSESNFFFISTVEPL